MEGEPWTADDGKIDGGPWTADDGRRTGDGGRGEKDGGRGRETGLAAVFGLPSPVMWSVVCG
jgi:hypothetical protein